MRRRLSSEHSDPVLENNTWEDETSERTRKDLSTDVDRSERSCERLRDESSTPQEETCLWIENLPPNCPDLGYGWRKGDVPAKAPIPNFLR